MLDPRAVSWRWPILCFAIIGCQPNVVDLAADVAAIRAADARFTAAVAAKDLDGIMAQYADDASLLPAATPIANGLDAIRTEWEHTLAIPGFSNTAEMTQVDVSGDLAYTQGTYEATLAAPDGQLVVERGKWVAVWKRQQDQTWKIVADIYNTDEPPPEHK